MEKYKLIALAGISAVGKTFFTNHLLENFNFLALPSVTTRKPRKLEKDGIDKFFVSDKTFTTMNNNGELICTNSMFGSRYATNIHFANKMLKKTNLIGQFRYFNFQELKEHIPTISIYIYSNDVKVTEKKLKARNMNKSEIKQRLDEMYTELEVIKTLKNKKIIDYTFINNYDKESEINFINFINKLKTNKQLIL